jgi:hypothetical protein
MTRFAELSIYCGTLAAIFVSHGVAQQNTTGYCSPAIASVTGNVVTNCYITVAELKKGIEDNLRDAISEIRQLLKTQRYYMFPSLDDYRANPTQETWKAARGAIDLVSKRVAVTINAAILYDASLEPELGPNLSELHNALRSRAGLLSQLPERPPSIESLTEWRDTYLVQVVKLNRELSALEARFKTAQFRQKPSDIEPLRESTCNVLTAFICIKRSTKLTHFAN